MIEQTARSIRKLTFKNHWRYFWHTGRVFGKEYCVGVNANLVWRLFGLRLWRIEIDLVPYEKIENTMIQSDGSHFELYPRGDAAKLGKPI